MNAADFFAWEESIGHHSNWTDEIRKERVSRFKQLSVDDKFLVKRGGIGKFFIPENAQLDRQESFKSPSGKYVLVTTPYSTTKGGWSYMLGEIYRVDSEGLRVKITQFQRNYSRLFFQWFESHPLTGQDYMLTGEDYQGFTVINLTTGNVASHIPDSAFEGHGWCPASFDHFPTPDTSKFVVKVTGCYWAFPYEVRLYDFSNPDSPSFKEMGLPWLTDGLWLDSDDEDEHVLSIEEDGTLVFSELERRFVSTGEWERDIDNKRFGGERRYKAMKLPEKEREAELALIKEEERQLDALYNYDDTSLWEMVPQSRKFYALVDGLFQELPEKAWKSERRSLEEKESEEWEQKSKLEFKHYRDTDPIYQLVKQAWPDDYFSRTGQTFQSQADRWDGDDNPFHFSIRANEKSATRHTASLKWGASSGSIFAECWTYGVGAKTTEFPRTAEGLGNALALIQLHLQQSE